MLGTRKLCKTTVQAVLLLVLGLSMQFIDETLFLVAYANAISFALFLVISAILGYPRLLTEIEEMVDRGYAKSTLARVDIDQPLKKLELLMETEKIYRDENLGLAALAQMTGLNGHQLSELINTQFGKGFSRYIREYRVSEAERLLRTQPEASVLAIGLEVGFKSQSGFYSAFKEVTGTSPGNFRK